MNKSKPKTKKPHQVDSSHREIEALKATVESLKYERDLYRREWLKSYEERIPGIMSYQEAQAILSDNITLEEVIAEIEPMLSKSKSA